MKDRETQLAFIKARAEGKSFSTITKELGIAKATCSSWENAFRSDIDALKQAGLEELYTAYNMRREARIRSLGTILQNIDNAIAEKPLEDLPADKLLELRLKYGRELKAEYQEPMELGTDYTLDGLIEHYNQLYMDSRSGNYSPAEIKARLSILDAIKGTVQKWAEELDREEDSGISVKLAYTSKLVRHEENQGA